LWLKKSRSALIKAVIRDAMIVAVSMATCIEAEASPATLLQGHTRRFSGLQIHQGW